MGFVNRSCFNTIMGWCLQTARLEGVVSYVSQQCTCMSTGGINKSGLCIMIVQNKTLWNICSFISLVRISHGHENKCCGYQTVKNNHRVAKSAQGKPKSTETDYHKHNHHLGFGLFLLFNHCLGFLDLNNLFAFTGGYDSHPWFVIILIIVIDQYIL